MSLEPAAFPWAIGRMSFTPIVKAKHGDADAVVALAVLPQYAPLKPPGCTGEFDHKNKLRDLINMF